MYTLLLAANSSEPILTLIGSFKKSRARAYLLTKYNIIKLLESL